MNWIDIFCLLVVLVFTLVGLWKGFLRSLFHLLAWICAIAGAYCTQDIMGPFISHNLEMDGFSVTLVCACIGFLIPFLGFTFVGYILHKKIKGTSASKVNRGLGGFLGIIKAFIICFVFLTILHFLPVSGELHDTRNNAIAYSVYKWTIECMGFSSEEIDLFKIAEEKAEEAAESVKESAKKAIEEEVDKATEKAKESVKDAAAKKLEEVSK